MRIKANRIFFWFLLVFTLETLQMNGQPSNIADIDRYVQTFREKHQISDLIEKKLKDSTQWELQNLDEAFYVTIERQTEKSAKVVEWYFAGSFILYSETTWWSLSAMQPIDNEKTYHQDGKMIAWLLPGHGFANSNSPEYKKRDRELREIQKQLRANASE